MRPCWNPRCSQPANWCGKIHKFFHSTGNFFTKQPTPERYYKFLTISFLHCGTRVGGRRTPMTALSASWVGNADFPFEISWQLENWVSRLFRNGKKIISDNQDNGGFLPSLSKWKPNIWKFEKLRHLGSLVTKSENGSSLKSTSYKLGRKLFPCRSDKDRPKVTYFISQIIIV